jgi:hypothetical protein
MERGGTSVSEAQATRHHSRWKRNDKLVDVWSATHVAWGAAMTMVFGPAYAWALMALWEPVEVMMLSPFLARFGIRFGHESLRNSLSDIAFNTIGVALGWALLPDWDVLGVG